MALINNTDKKVRVEWLACGVYAAIALAVMLPLLLPGFILTLDMVFTPHLPMPDQVTSSYLFHAGLHVLNIIIPSEILEKIMLLTILLLSMIGLHRLIRVLPYRRREGEWGIYVASVFFAINPFTYSRFMAGQYAVLLGYAMLPWFVRSLVLFGRRPSAQLALRLGGLVTVIGIVSIHTLGAVAILSLAAVVIALLKRQKLAAWASYGGLALAVFIVLSSYWLLPLLAGHGPTASTISGFTAADTQAFATAGGNAAAQTGNVLRLQGFWAETRGLYLLPQDQAVLWGLMSLIIIGLAVTGGVVLWRNHRTPAALLTISGLAGLVLAIGFLSPVLSHLPLAAGYREPQKFAMLLALTYAVFLAIGIDMAIHQLRQKNETLYAVSAVVILILPVLYMRVMFWGFDGQLSPRDYPNDWAQANELLNRDPDTFNTMFLPWHQYMSFQFAGRIIANPAPNFFSKPVLVSADPELGGAKAISQTPQQAALAAIVSRAQGPKTATDLAGQNVKYILLDKDIDYKQYSFLQHNPQFKRIANYQSLDVYQNLEWRSL